MFPKDFLWSLEHIDTFHSGIPRYSVDTCPSQGRHYKDRQAVYRLELDNKDETTVGNTLCIFPV